MLTEKERHRVIVFLRYFSNVNFFPIQVDPQGWEIRSGCESKWKAWACKLAYAAFIIHVVHKSLSLVYVLLFLNDVPLHQILIHVIIAASSAFFVFWQYDLYWKNADVSTAFWKVSLTGKIVRGEEKIIHSRFYADYL